MIDDHVDLLGAFDLVGARHRVPPPRRRLPIDIDIIVAGLILAELLEITPLSDLPDLVTAVVAAHQENAREAASFSPQVGINPDFGGEGKTSPDEPQPEKGTRLDMERFQEKPPPSQRHEGVLDLPLFSLREGSDPPHHHFAFHPELRGDLDPVAEPVEGGAAVGEGHGHGEFASLRAAEQLRELDRKPVETASRDDEVGKGHGHKQQQEEAGEGSPDPLIIHKDRCRRHAAGQGHPEQGDVGGEAHRTGHVA